MSNFYLQHRGLIINLSSLGVFFLMQQLSGGSEMEALLRSPLIATIFLIAYFFEPWAIYYSMGVYNEKREKEGIPQHSLQRYLGGMTLVLLIWAGRIALFGALFVGVVNMRIPKDSPYIDYILIPLVLILMVREGFNVYYMASKKPIKNYDPRYDYLSDLILMITLVFGEILIRELMSNFQITYPNDFDSWMAIIFPTLLVVFTFYLPIRYTQTLEDFTFAHTRGQKVEVWISMLALVFGLVIFALRSI